MNLFVTSECPSQAARILDDKRVVKMCLETTQLLMTALYAHGLDPALIPYKPTHQNHPITKWVCKNRSNYGWALKHLIALLKEYTLRYRKFHKCNEYVSFLINNMNALPEGKRTPFVNCAKNESLNLDYSDEKDVTLAYALYLTMRWSLDKRVPTWYGKRG